MPLRSYKGYNRTEAMLRAGGRCACGNKAVTMSCGYPACQRCLEFEVSYYASGKHNHGEKLANGAESFGKYYRVYSHRGTEARR